MPDLCKIGAPEASDPPAGLFAADVDVTVIRVPHEPMAATLKLAIQFIQHEIREQTQKVTSALIA